MIDKMTPSSVSFKLRFGRPDLISMSSQSEEDRLIVKFDKTFIINDVNGNSMVFDGGVNNADTIEFPLPMQTQVVEGTAETKSLEATADSVQNSGAFVMLGQFLLSYITGAGLVYFFSFVNSQQNICYLPLLTVSNPGHVNFYMNTLISLGSFDPIPLGKFYELGWPKFEWVSVKPTRSNFARLGIDRNFVFTLGTSIIALVGFGLSQLVTYSLAGCTEDWRIRRIYNYFKFDGPARVFFILFVLEMYIDLVMGGLVNMENWYLLDVPGNFGPNGHLPLGDQLGIILGCIFTILCVMFPFLVVYVHWKKSREHFALTGDVLAFDRLYGCLYEDFKTSAHPVFHYYTQFLIRRIIYAVVCFIFYEEHYTFLQVIANVNSSFWFTLYLVRFRPFLDESMNNLQIINEGAFVVVSYHQLCFTDYVQSAAGKSMMGWSMVLVALSNLIWPNGYLVVSAMIPEVREMLCSNCTCKKGRFAKSKRDRIEELRQMKEEERREFFEEKRAAFIKKYRFKLKRIEECQHEDDDVEAPRGNQVLPSPTFSHSLWCIRRRKLA
jgi:hypothetical protein